MIAVAATSASGDEPTNKDGGKKAKKFPKQVFYSPDLYSTVALDDADTTMTIINLMFVASLCRRQR